MKVRFFTIPVVGSDEQEKALNEFLAAHRIVAIERQFVQAGLASVWSLCVTWTEAREKLPVRKGKVDYKQVLDEQQFTVYAAVRELRKNLAEQEGVPAYALFTNEQLAEMIIQRVNTQNGLAKIKGVGQARVDKYGKQFLDCLQQQWQKVNPNANDEKNNATQSG